MSSNVIIGHVLITIGAVFDFFGALGLLRLPDVYCRLQAATKCVTMGTMMILIGTAVTTASPWIALKALICAVFIAITSPTAADALARGSYLSGVRLSDRSIVDDFKERAEALRHQHGEAK